MSIAFFEDEQKLTSSTIVDFRENRFNGQSSSKELSMIIIRRYISYKRYNAIALLERDFFSLLDLKDNCFSSFILF